MNVLVACEFSGRVREAFLAKGHNAWSVDLLPTDIPSDKHYQGCIKEFITNSEVNWDLLIAFPPCTHLAASGALYWSKRQKEQEEALDFVKYLLNLSIEKIAIENPIGKIATAIRKADQIIQPYMFGHPETKSTCLWLKNLCKLEPSDFVPPPYNNRIAKMPDSKGRAKRRSLTYQGIAECMADTWG